MHLQLGIRVGRGYHDIPLIQRVTPITIQDHPRLRRTPFRLCESFVTVSVTYGYSAVLSDLASVVIVVLDLPSLVDGIEDKKYLWRGWKGGRMGGFVRE